MLSMASTEATAPATPFALLAGASMEVEPPSDPWNRPSPSRPFAVELHAFAWLPSLMLQGERGAREAVRLTLAWGVAFAEGPLQGILGYEERPLVSVDYARDTRSSIVDALSTMVTDGTLLKVYAWYDNEMGYACRMVDLACHMQQVGV